MSDRPETPVFQTDTTNAEIRNRWRLSEDADPASMSLDELDPGNSGWFVANKELQVFDRLRAEAPVHFTPDSQFGPYWSVTRFDDVKHVDTHHKIFSSVMKAR